MSAFSSIIMAGSALMGLQSARDMKTMSARQAREALEERKKQQKRLDKEVAAYRDIKFTNPYADMENPYEDLQVATGAAEFQAQQAAQQRANILNQFRGAAGGSGIAGLAQTMANQGQLQTRQISANLQQQEMANEMARAKGTGALDMAERGGEAMVQEAVTGRQATILGMQYGQAAGANKGYQQSLLNQRYANIAANQMIMSSMKTLGGVAEGMEGGGGGGSGFEDYISGLNLTEEEKAKLRGFNPEG